MATYQQSIKALVDGLKTLFENRTCTEAQAIANATSKPNTIYYTTDTKCVVVGGQIYGRGQQIIANVFAYLPASEQDPSDPAFSDTSKIYVQPTSTAGVMRLWWWLNGQWLSTDTQAMSVPASAEDISYDLTPTPDLGTGDVQSAIEALDGKVEAVDARIDDEKVEFIKTWFPSTDDGISFGVSGVTVNYSATIQNNSLVFTANSGYRVRYTTTMIPKGSIVTINLYYGNPPGGWTGRDRFAITTTNPVTYIAENGSIVGLPNTLILAKNASQGSIRNYEYYASEDCWLIFEWQNAYNPITPTITHIFPSIFFKERLVDLYTEYYQKGVADGSGMASIVGLGYNIYDYITGDVNMEGFEYGCKIHKSTPSISGNCDSLYKSNTSFVYFPRMDMTGVTRLYSFVQYCTNMIVFPETTFNGSINAQNMFSGCTKLKRVGKLDGLNVEVGLYMFAGCVALERIEEVDISDMVMTSHKSTTNMFRSNSSTGSGTSVLSNLRYILLKGIGTLSSVTAYWFNNAQNWGVNTTAISDAKQSLIDSLYTYSFDRATAGYSNCTIHVYSNTLNALTTAEREQITAKGYILTTS